MAPSQDNAYWDYYYSQPPYGLSYWSVNVMALADRPSQSRGGPGNDNSLGLSHPGSCDLLESEPEVVSSCLPPLEIILHRDLSSNSVLLIGTGNSAKVTDFGMAKLFSMNRTTMTHLTMCPGTLDITVTSSCEVINCMTISQHFCQVTDRPS